MRVLFISRLLSAFQVEVGEELNRHPDIDYRIAFTMRKRDGRGQPHWTSFGYDEERYPVMPEGGDPTSWLAQQIREYRPDVLISGQVVHELYDAVVATADDVPYTLGFWMEPPDFQRPAAYLLAARQVARLRLSLADFIFAIGERAERFFRACAPHAEMYLIPYGADLAYCFEGTPEEKRSERMRFLFSGQLLARHNIAVIAESLVRLSKRRPDQFEFVFSGRGPEQHHIDAALDSAPGLKSVVRFDDEFQTWTDRLRPFRYSSVFVYPCTHTGWGLVIPEAMAAGMAVVGARGAESLRYFVRHRVNGVVIRPDVDELTREMERCILDPGEVARMGARARIDARDGHAPVVAERVANALRRVSRRPRGRLTSTLARIGQIAGRVRGA